ncbi:MAG: hypothetical protein ACFB22_04035 [Rhodothalassiaceae bacterium]
MRQQWFRRALVGLMAMALVPLSVAAPAQAGGVKVYHGGVHVGGGVRFGHRHRFHRPYWRHHRRHFGYRYGRGFRHYPYGYRPRGSRAGAVLFGLGAGILASEAIRQSRQPDRVIIQERVVAPTDRSVFRSAPRPQPQDWQEPVAPPRHEPGFAPGECLQIREYQTVVIVGGEEVDAYGDACLQPDGSWLRGPAKIDPYS